MADKKPLKLDLDSVSGNTMLMQFQAGDTLPVEAQVEILKNLFNRLLISIAENKIPINDKYLLQQLEAAIKTI